MTDDDRIALILKEGPALGCADLSVDELVRFKDMPSLKDHAEAISLMASKLIREQYVSQVARDKARAEREKQAYEARGMIAPRSTARIISRITQRDYNERGECIRKIVETQYEGWNEWKVGPTYTSDD